MLITPPPPAQCQRQKFLATIRYIVSTEATFSRSDLYLTGSLGEMRRCWGRVARAEIYFGNGKINLLYTPLILTLERLR